MEKITKIIENNPWAAIYILILIVLFIFRERIKSFYADKLVPKMVASLLKDKGEKKEQTEEKEQK